MSTQTSFQWSILSAHGCAAGKRSAPVSGAKRRFCVAIPGEGQNAPERIKNNDQK
jgi:hypothetical protein